MVVTPLRLKRISPTDPEEAAGKPAPPTSIRPSALTPELFSPRDSNLLRLGLFGLLMACGFAIFGAPLFMADEVQVAYRSGLTAALLISAVMLRRLHQSRYFPLTFAFFIASFVYSLDFALYNYASFPWLPLSRMELFVFYKLLSTLLMVISIILLTKASGGDMGSICLAKGNLRLGLAIGLVTFLFFLATSMPASTWLYGGRDLALGRLISWAPLVMTFVLLNGLKEELLYRGLFMKKYGAFLGPSASNLLQAAIFVVPHIGEAYSSAYIIFLLIVLLLGLAFGATMQKTNSLLGSTLFHAGTDIPVILGIFSNM